MSVTFAAVVLLLTQDNYKFYEQIASVDVLQGKDVQAELKVTDTQVNALNKYGGTYNSVAGRLKDGYQKGQVSKGEFDRAIQDAQEQLHTQILLELKKEQVVRLGQITLQRAGILAILNSTVATQIGLTEAQSKALRDGIQKTGREVAEVERAAKEPILLKYKAMEPKSDDEKKKLSESMENELAEANSKIQPDLKRLRKGFEDLVESTLTKAQMETWKQLKGPVFSPKKEG